MADAAQASKVRFRVEGMDCAACATKVKNAVFHLPGVNDVAISVPAGTVAVTYDTGTAMDVGEIRSRIARLGYRVTAVDPELDATPADKHQHSDDRRDAHDLGSLDWKNPKTLLTLACGLALGAAFLIGKLLPATEYWAFLAAMLVGLVPIARRAVVAAMTGTPFSIETLMSVAAIGAVIIGATEEAATVILLFLIGELLEGVAANRARSSIQALTRLVPSTARLEEGGTVREVPAATLAVDSIVQVRPGDRIPADGTILAGESAINEAPVTGESVPVRKKAGEIVFAGTVNGEGLLRLRVTASAADNTIARVVRLVEEAQGSKAPTERFIDRFSRYYTPGVVVMAAMVAILPPLLFGAVWHDWIYKGLAILLIGCPCALVISTPAAIAASLAAGARRGLLLKGGTVLERLRDVTLVSFDKTGTLTTGKPKVTDVVSFGRDEIEVLAMAASLERGSSHPLAAAITEAAADRKIELSPMDDFVNLAGEGIEASVQGRKAFLGSPAAADRMCSLRDDDKKLIEALNDEGKTVSVLVVEGEAAGCIAMRDEPRPDAARGIKELADMGIRAIMLTGDNPRTAAAVAHGLGLDYRAQLMPQDKQRIVNEYRDKGEVVLKVGDGINDAPALAAADIGVAMGGGTDVALETADAAVLHGRVTDVPAMVDLSKRTMANIQQNIAISLSLKAVFLVTTILGITGLWPAILADTGATVLVTLNALRLLRVRLGTAASVAVGLATDKSA